MLGGGGGVAIRMFWYAFSEKKKKWLQTDLFWTSECMYH